MLYVLFQILTHLVVGNHAMLSSVSYRCLAFVVCVSSQVSSDQTGPFSQFSSKSSSSFKSYAASQGMQRVSDFWASSGTSHNYDPINNFRSNYPHSSMNTALLSIQPRQYRTSQYSGGEFSPRQYRTSIFSGDEFSPGQYRPSEFGGGQPGHYRPSVFGGGQPGQYSPGQYRPSAFGGGQPGYSPGQSATYPRPENPGDPSFDNPFDYETDTQTPDSETETDILGSERYRNYDEFTMKKPKDTKDTLKLSSQYSTKESVVAGSIRYIQLAVTISRVAIVQYDTHSPKSNNTGSRRDLGDPYDVEGFLFGHGMMESSDYVFPMHPSTWEIWKTKVVKPIYDSLGSTMDHCGVTLFFLYQSKNDTRPDGFYVLAGHLRMDGEFRQMHHLVKGYVSNPSTKFNKNVVVQEAWSSPLCTEVLDRVDQYGLTSVPSDTSGYLARYEWLTVERIMSHRWSESGSDTENSSTPATLGFFQDLISRYGTNPSSIPRSLRSMGKPVNPIPDSKEFGKIWKTKFETPLWNSSNSLSPENSRLKRASITLNPTYDGDSVTPSGLLIVGSRDRGPPSIVTYIQLPITSELPSVSTERPQNESVNTCQLPPKPKGTEYRIGDCQPNQKDGICEKEPGSWVMEYTQINYECDTGYVLPRIKDVDWSDSLCIEGEWEPRIRCQKKCGPLISPAHDITCKFYGKSVSCAEEVFPGTVAKPKCKSHFHALEPVEVYSENACLADGNWEYDLFECVPDCGLSNTTTNRFRVAYGEDVVPGDYPWSAGLFWKKNGTFEHFCGGSIIHSNLILTAAHCIYDEATGMDREPSDIIVAVGKFNISWDLIDAHEQRIKVLRINKPSSYGRSSSIKSYFDDIAVIVLSELIIFSKFRLPVCLDWRRRGSFRNGTLGTMVGWGENEHHQPSDSLQCAVLAYLDDNTCSEMSPGYFRNHMQEDKFCVGSGEDYGTSAQPGDSGGGFTFIRYKIHFLYGVLSIRPQYRNTFALFTNVTQKLDWLQQWAKTWPTPN